MIRQLRPSEERPEGDPKRYVNAAGYVRLRWRVGPRAYVETYERHADGSLVRNHPPIAKRVPTEAAISMYEAGKTMPEIADALGCNSGTVSRLLRRHGVTARQTGDYHPKADPDTVVRLYRDENYSPDDIAFATGVGPIQIRKILKAHGVMRRPGKPRTTRRDSWFRELARMRPLVIERARGFCEIRLRGICTGPAEHVHHRRRRTQGGDNSMENLVATCCRCHLHLHANPADAYLAGLLVRSWEDPSEVPVRIDL